MQPGSRQLAYLIMALLVIAASAVSARAEHALIDLQVIAPDDRAEATSDQEPPIGGVNPRPKLAVRAGDPLILHFILTNAYPHGLLKDVTVRYFVVRTDKIGEKQLPDLEGHTVTQGHVVLNLKPKCRVGARLQFRIDKPGIYLVRVDTLNTHSDHEHFSAIDLEVK